MPSRRFQRRNRRACSIGFGTSLSPASGDRSLAIGMRIGWAATSLFHGKRHPPQLGAGEVRQFLEHVAHSEKDPLRCLEQAHEALTFLYKDLLGLNLGDVPVPEPPKLLDRVRHAIRVRHYSPRTEECYVEWAERFIRFHGLRHPNRTAFSRSPSSVVE